MIAAPFDRNALIAGNRFKLAQQHGLLQRLFVAHYQVGFNLPPRFVEFGLGDRLPLEPFEFVIDGLLDRRQREAGFDLGLEIKQRRINVIVKAGVCRGHRLIALDEPLIKPR